MQLRQSGPHCPTTIMVDCRRDLYQDPLHLPCSIQASTPARNHPTMARALCRIMSTQLLVTRYNRITRVIGKETAITWRRCTCTTHVVCPMLILRGKWGAILTRIHQRQCHPPPRRVPKHARPGFTTRQVHTMAHHIQYRGSRISTRPACQHSHEPIYHAHESISVMP